MEVYRKHAPTAWRQLLLLLLSVSLPLMAWTQQARLGCFTLSKLQMFKGGAYRGNCVTVCGWKKQPLWASDNRFCFCGATIPSPAEALDPSACQQGTEAVFLHYVNANASQACSLSPLPWNWDNWQELPSVSNTGVATLQFGKPVGPSVGVTLFSWDAHQYGAYSLALQPSPELGAVAALYLISDRGVPPLVNPWDEIDFEFVNYAWEGRVQGPTLWSNTFVNGTHHAEGPIGKAMPKIVQGFNTYLIDWQPAYVRWYMNGVMVKETNTSVQPLPVKPMYTGVSFWHPNATICRFFGGCGSFDGLQQAYAGDLKRILCQ